MDFASSTEMSVMREEHWIMHKSAGRYIQVDYIYYVMTVWQSDFYFFLKSNVNGENFKKQKIQNMCRTWGRHSQTRALEEKPPNRGSHNTERGHNKENKENKTRWEGTQLRNTAEQNLNNETGWDYQNKIGNKHWDYTLLSMCSFLFSQVLFQFKVCIKPGTLQMSRFVPTPPILLSMHQWWLVCTLCSQVAQNAFHLKLTKAAMTHKSSYNCK